MNRSALNRRSSSESAIESRPNSPNKNVAILTGPFMHGRPRSTSKVGQGFIQRGGRGDLSPSWFWQGGGDIPPIKLQNSVFLMGILVKSFKKVFRRQIPFFSKFVFSNCPPPPPIIFFLAETLWATKSHSRVWCVRHIYSGLQRWLHFF